MKDNDTTKTRTLINNNFENVADQIVEGLPAIDITALLKTFSTVRSDLTVDGTFRRMGYPLKGGNSFTLMGPGGFVDGGDLVISKSLAMGLVIDASAPADEDWLYQYASVPIPLVEVSEEADAEYAEIVKGVVEKMTNQKILGRVEGKKKIALAALSCVMAGALANLETLANGEEPDLERIKNMGANFHITTAHYMCGQRGVSVIAKEYATFAEFGFVPIVITVRAGGGVAVFLTTMGEGMDDSVFESIFGEEEAA